MEMPEIKVNHIETKSVMTKSNGPLGGYAVNPYVGGFKKTIIDYIAEKYSDLMPLYDEIYSKKNRSFFEALEKKAEGIAEKYGCRYVDDRNTHYETGLGSYAVNLRHCHRKAV